MAIFNIFKNKKKELKKKKPVIDLSPFTKGERVEEKTEVQNPAPKKAVSAGPQEVMKKKKDFAPVYNIVKMPHISEKATNLGQVNQYVFKVFPRARKSEIKKAIERIYGVDVLSVNVIAIPAKKRRLGKTTGFKQGYKKAIVKIRAGQKIEIL